MVFKVALLPFIVYNEMMFEWDGPKSDSQYNAI